MVVNRVNQTSVPVFLPVKWHLAFHLSVVSLVGLRRAVLHGRAEVPAGDQGGGQDQARGAHKFWYQASRDGHRWRGCYSVESGALFFWLSGYPDFSRVLFWCDFLESALWAPQTVLEHKWIMTINVEIARQFFCAEPWHIPLRAAWSNCIELSVWTAAARYPRDRVTFGVVFFSCVSSIESRYISHLYLDQCTVIFKQLNLLWFMSIFQRILQGLPDRHL